MDASVVRPNRTSLVISGILFLLLAVLYGGWVWTGELTDFGGDSAGYLLAARYYSPYHGSSAAILAYKSQIIFPPLFPWLLALVDGGYDILAAHLTVAAFALSSTLVLYLWLRRESLPHWPSMAVALVFSLMPAFYVQVLNIWTEFPFVFLSLCVVTLLSPTNRTPSTRAWIVAAILVASATLTRMAALPLLVAFLVLLGIRRPRHYVAIALVATLPFAAWAFYSAHTEIGASAYLVHWEETYAHDPVATFLRQILTEFRALLIAWKSGWIGSSTSLPLLAIVFAVALMSLMGWLHRLRSLRFDAIYVAVYLCVLLAWPHPEEATRYAMVIYPVLLGEGFLFLASFKRPHDGTSRRFPVVGLAIALLALAMLPTLAINVQYFTESVPPQFAGAKRMLSWYNSDRETAVRDTFIYISLISHLKQVGRFVPEHECIFSTKPAVVILYTDRFSRTPPKASASEAQFWKEIEACQFAYLMPLVSPSFHSPLYPARRLGDAASPLTTRSLVLRKGKYDGVLVRIDR